MSKIIAVSVSNMGISQSGFGCGGRRITCVRFSFRLYQKDFAFIFCAGAVGNTARDDKDLASFDRMAGVRVIHHHLTLEDEEKVVGFLVQVKGELALEFDDHDFVVIIVGHDMRVPVGADLGKLFGQVDGIAHAVAFRSGSVGAAAMRVLV